MVKFGSSVNIKMWHKYSNKIILIYNEIKIHVSSFSKSAQNRKPRKKERKKEREKEEKIMPSKMTHTPLGPIV